MFTWEASNVRRTKAKAATVVFRPNTHLPTDFESYSKHILPTTVASLQKRCGFQALLPCQAQCFASISRRRDVILHSCTGSGKTIAFVLPIVERLLKDKAGVRTFSRFSQFQKDPSATKGGDDDDSDDDDGKKRGGGASASTTPKAPPLSSVIEGAITPWEGVMYATPYTLIFVFSMELASQIYSVIERIYGKDHFPTDEELNAKGRKKGAAAIGGDIKDPNRIKIRVGVVGLHVARGDAVAAQGYDILIGMVQDLDGLIRGGSAPKVSKAERGELGQDGSDDEEDDESVSDESDDSAEDVEEALGLPPSKKAADKRKPVSKKAAPKKPSKFHRRPAVNPDVPVVNCKGVRAIVVDEVDVTLGPRFSHTGRRMKGILKVIRRANGSLSDELSQEFKAHQYVLCGATVPNWVLKAGFLGQNKYYFKLVEAGVAKLPPSLNCWSVSVPKDLEAYDASDATNGTTTATESKSLLLTPKSKKGAAKEEEAVAVEEKAAISVTPTLQVMAGLVVSAFRQVGTSANVASATSMSRVVIFVADRHIEVLKQLIVRGLHSSNDASEVTSAKGGKSAKGGSGSSAIHVPIYTLGTQDDEAGRLTAIQAFNDRAPTGTHAPVVAAASEGAAEGSTERVPPTPSVAHSGVMICTDRACRGIDFADVDTVITSWPPHTSSNAGNHKNPAMHVDTLVHRVGRAARAGKSGQAIVVFDSRNAVASYVNVVTSSRADQDSKMAAILESILHVTLKPWPETNLTIVGSVALSETAAAAGSSKKRPRDASVDDKKAHQQQHVAPGVRTLALDTTTTFQLTVKPTLMRPVTASVGSNVTKAAPVAALSASGLVKSSLTQETLKAIVGAITEPSAGVAQFTVPRALSASVRKQLWKYKVMEL